MASAICHGLDLYPGHLTLRWSWPWPLNDRSRSKVKVTLWSNVEVKVIILQGHKVIVLLHRRLTVHGLDLLPWIFHLETILTLTFKWPSKIKFKCQGHLKVKCQGHLITRSQGHCVTLQTSYCSWPWPLPWTFDLEPILTLTLKWPS